MTVQEKVLLAPFSTLLVGGPARYFVTAQNSAELREALAFVRERSLPLAILGGGSNTLIPDEGFDGMVIRIAIPGIEFDESEGGVMVTVGAGVIWDQLVKEAAARNLWGIENLAGIPGSVGGAVVQNIGAYGAELAPIFLKAEVMDIETGEMKEIDHGGAHFSYRHSIFKENRRLAVTRVTLMLSRTPCPELSYPDLARAQESGEYLDTPEQIGAVVRDIRANKFPVNEGTAGSFFKNPIVRTTDADALRAKFKGLPTFSHGNDHTKISLAWLLDKVFGLRGYTKGQVRLFERQPLVIVAMSGAAARDVDALANEIAERVSREIGVSIEREVETLRAR